MCDGVDRYSHTGVGNVPHRLRFGLLRLAAQSVAGQRMVSNAVISCMSALAQQCFLNEYVYIQGEEETRQSISLRDLLSERLRNTGEVPPLLLAAVGTYFPLYQLPNAENSWTVNGQRPSMNWFAGRCVNLWKNSKIAPPFQG